jgi:hypothetical protein
VKKPEIIEISFIKVTKSKAATKSSEKVAKYRSFTRCFLLFFKGSFLFKCKHHCGIVKVKVLGKIGEKYRRNNL